MPADSPRPTAEDMITAVREYLHTALLPDVPAEHAFHLRIAVNILGMVERELADAGAATTRHHDRLTDLGYSNDAELSEAIRSGIVSARQLPDVLHAMRADVQDRLELADPMYVSQYRHD